MPQKLQAPEHLASLRVTEDDAVLIESMSGVPLDGMVPLQEVANKLGITVERAHGFMVEGSEGFAIGDCGGIFAFLVLYAAAIVYSRGHVSANDTGPVPSPISNTQPYYVNVANPAGFDVSIARSDRITTFKGKPTHIDLIRKQNQHFLQASVEKDVVDMVLEMDNDTRPHRQGPWDVTVKTEVGDTTFRVTTQPQPGSYPSTSDVASIKEEVHKGLGNGWTRLIPPE